MNQTKCIIKEKTLLPVKIVVKHYPGLEQFKEMYVCSKVKKRLVYYIFGIITPSLNYEALKELGLTEQEGIILQNWILDNENLIISLQNGGISVKEFENLMFKAKEIPSQVQKGIQLEFLKILSEKM